jgi:membrane associated rhomboid family serine protease
MIPLWDAERRPVDFPVVTLLIIAVNAIAFIFELMGGDAFVLRWSAVPAEITAGHHLETIVTSMFMHGGWAHILGNMVFLWAFGPEIEDVMGRGKYLVFYLAGGIVAMAAQIAAMPHSTVPTLGASGAIAAVMGAFLVTYPRDRIRTVLFLGVFANVTFIPAIVLIGLWFVYQLLAAGIGSIAPVDNGGVAYLAHVGGAVFGALAARWFEDPQRLAERAT